MCIEVCCSLQKSDKKCCLCVKVANAITWIQIVDIFELVATAALIYLYVTRSVDITFVAWAPLLFGNTIPVFFRLLGGLLRLCGAFRLWTRTAFFCCRLVALLFSFVLLGGQIFLQIYLIQDKIENLEAVPFLGQYFGESQATQMGASNYNMLEYGFCTFCDPASSCQTEFADYKKTGDNVSMFEWISRIANTESAEKPFPGVEEYAHQGLSKEQCTYATVISLLPYLYWVLWQLHFVIVAKAHSDQGHFEVAQKQVAAWRRASDILNAAGLSSAGIAPHRVLTNHQTSMQSLVVQDIENEPSSSVDPSASLEPPQEVSNRNLLPPIRGALPQQFPTSRSRGMSANSRLNFTSSMAGYTNSQISRHPVSRVSLMHAPSQESLELTNYTSNTYQSGRRSHMASHGTIVTATEMMGKETAERWFDQSTRVFRKVEEQDDDIPFYEANRRKKTKETIDYDEIEAQMCAICQLRIQNLDEIIELKCQHLYHKECARPWVLEKKKCPLCRKRQFTSPEPTSAQLDNRN